jgi:hypothetical protein
MSVVWPLVTGDFLAVDGDPQGDYFAVTGGYLALDPAADLVGLVVDDYLTLVHASYGQPVRVDAAIKHDLRVGAEIQHDLDLDLEVREQENDS